jgi:hypothetical protein
MLPCDVEEVAGSSRAAAARVAIPTVSAARTTAAVTAQRQVLVRDGRLPRLDGQGGGLIVGMLTYVCQRSRDTARGAGRVVLVISQKGFLKVETRSG